MKQRLKSLVQFFQNALLAPPVGRLLRRSFINGILAYGVSTTFVAIVFGVAALMGISLEAYLPDIKIDSIFMLIIVVIVAPLIETLILAVFFMLIPRRLGLVKRAIISAILWGILHALSAPLWFIGVIFSFFVFSCGYLVWRQKSFACAFVAALLPHVFVNFVACMPSAVSNGIFEHGVLFNDDQSYTYIYKSFDELPFKESAEQGDAEAQWKVGHWFYCRHMNNDHDPKNYVEAAIWLRKAAEQGHPSAQHFLAQCYLQGDGVEKDLAEAVKWYRVAAEQGHAGSQDCLGAAYLYGWHGVEQDTEEGMKWLLRAAEQGEFFTWSRLGNIYAEGRNGVPQDKAEAIKWFRKVVGRSPTGHLGKEAAMKLKELEKTP